MVDDTPVVIAPSTSCDGTQNTCVSGTPDLRDMTENYMDYTGDCPHLFTEGQVIRMRSHLMSCRTTMYTNGLVFPTLLPPWLFVIDVSGSMGSEIDAVAGTLYSILDRLNADNQSPDFFVLSQYHAPPPEGTILAQANVYTSSNDFINDVDAITLDPGVICREYAFSGLNEALTQAINHDPSLVEPQVFLFSDADSSNQDPISYQTVESLFLAYDGSCNIILTDNCGSTGFVDTRFYNLADRTGGLLFLTDEDSVDSVVPIIDQFLISGNRNY